MRTIKFDKEEREILKEIISLGNSQYKNDFPEIGKFIFNKIRIEIFHFDKKEVQVLRSYTSNWINNYENLIDELREKYLGKENIDYENITVTEREAMHKISIVFSIKSKLFSEKYITFRKVLEKN
ncbi:hypothetical protein [Flavobacterium sp.]|uniref:hypothetical protein n=1 Tax=Flavobacterium sp. TaxID=239 RepID=UPI00260D6F51|nr:hypothetical protein [Flavobacterium sp.]